MSTPSDPRQAPRFIADVMLGRLARWLRFLGYDVLYDRRAEDPALAGTALREGLVLLTRDRALLERWRPPGAILLDSDDPLTQLRQVARALRLPPPRAGRARCTVCNDSLTPITPAEAASRVPEYVHRTRAEFARCAACGRIYWEGTHTARMRAALAAVWDEEPE